MAASIAGSASSLTRDPDAKAYFLNADGTGKAQGTLLKSPALAATFKTIAENGAKAFYTGPIAQDIVDSYDCRLELGRSAALGGFRVDVTLPTDR